MRDLNDLNFFVSVVAHEGFSAAGRALGVPKSRLSRRVVALEAQLGVRLVERSSRRFKVTEIGRDVYQHARAALSEAEAIEEVVSRRKAEPQGLVRISCPIGADRLLGAALPEFLARHPRLRLQVIVSNRRVDLIEEGIDIAIRAPDELTGHADLQVKILGRLRGMLVASPAFVAAHGEPSAPDEITAFPTLGRTDQPGLDRWTLVNAEGAEATILHEPRLSASAYEIIRQAAIDGVGIAMLMDWTCREFLQDGQLVRILPSWAARQMIVHLLFTSKRGMLPSVRAVIDFVAEVLTPTSAVLAAAAATAI